MLSRKILYKSSYDSIGGILMIDIHYREQFSVNQSKKRISHEEIKFM